MLSFAPQDVQIWGIVILATPDRHRKTRLRLRRRADLRCVEDLKRLDERGRL